LLNNHAQNPGANHTYGVGDGEGEGLFFFEDSVDDFFVVVAASFFCVEDLWVVEAGAFDGAVVVVVDSDLVAHELISPAASKTVIE
jgi:hypothetical protein